MLLRSIVTALAAALACAPAFAADKLKIAVFPATSALPFYVAQERGFFKEAGIEAEAVPMTTHPLIVQAIVQGDVDGASNVVTLEGANINQRRPGTLYYISLNGQNHQYIMEQFVVRAGHPAQSLKDLKGAKILSAPGPANLGAAKAVLKSIGLEENKDYTIQEQQMGVHLGALQAGTFDAGYTLEPAASMMIKQGVARRLEAGVIATYLMGRKDATAAAAGGALSGKLLTEKPDLAARYAKAWAKGVQVTQTDPSVRDLLPKHMNTAADIAPTVPLVRFVMVKDMTPLDYADFQKFVDIGVETGVVKGAIDVKSFLKAM